MRIGFNQFYFSMNQEIDTNVNTYKQEKEDLKESKKYLLSQLELSRFYIEQFSKLDFDKIADIKRGIPVSYFYVIKGLEVQRNRVIRNVNAVLEINKRIDFVTEQVEIWNKLRVDENVFKKVIKRFNQLISDKILEGYVFSLGHNISHIRIRKIVRRKLPKKSINWKESNEKKAEILARGGLPYKVLERDSRGKCIQHNGGEYWFIYFENLIYYTWWWAKRFCNIKNRNIYCFVPTRHSGEKNTGNANKLKRLALNENAEALKYFYEKS